MTKNEWLEGLRENLVAELPRSELDNHIMYYRDYIDQESGNKPITKVLDSLGEPRLIAKTIIDSYRMQRGDQDAYSDEGKFDYSNIYNSYKNKTSVESEDTMNKNSRGYRTYHISAIRWYHKVLVFAILALIISIIVIIGGIILRLVFTLGIPILAVILGYRLLKKR